MDNAKGRSIAFSTFSPFRAWHSRFAESVALFLAPINDVAARQPKFLHTAHFARVTPAHLRRAGLHSKTLRHGALLFVSAYNGDAEVYFRGFSEKLYPVMDEVWKHCVEWGTAEAFKNLSGFIGKFRRRSDTFFSAYPDESRRLRASLALRRQLDKLLTLARSEAPSADSDFERAFIKTAQLHWGNAVLHREDQ